MIFLFFAPVNFPGKTTVHARRQFLSFFDAKNPRRFKTTRLNFSPSLFYYPQSESTEKSFV